MSTTTACPKCGGPVRAGARYCSTCGADVRATQAMADTIAVPMRAPSRAISASRLPSIPRQDEIATLLREAVAGDYDILGELGRGGMATVFLARERLVDRKVAIKVMSPMLLYGDGMAERFMREAKTAGGLSHPNIIPIHAVRETEKLLFFVMKFVEGRALDSIIKELGPLPIRMVQTILTQVAGALGHAHRRHVIHRDIKPANIMIDEDGDSMVTDFGIAKVENQSELTRAGAAIGTPIYMSPEQCAGSQVTVATDQYSLGVVAYEMLTGRPPFQAASVMDLMRAHFDEQPRPIEQLRGDCPPALARVVLRMLEKDPADRFPAMDDVKTAIGAPPLVKGDPLHHQMMELGRSGQQSRPREPAGPLPTPGSRPRVSVQPSPSGGVRPSKVVERPSKVAERPRAPTPPVSRPSIQRPAPPAASMARWAGGIGVGVLAVLVGWLAMHGRAARPSPVPGRPEAGPAASAPKPAAPAAATAHIVVSTRGRGVTLSVNGRNLGPVSTRPTDFTVPAGSDVIQAVAPGCRPAEQKVTLRAGERRDLGRLTPACPGG